MDKNKLVSTMLLSTMLLGSLPIGQVFAQGDESAGVDGIELTDISLMASYADTVIDEKVAEGYIPIATVDELESIMYADAATFGAGTKWEAEYTAGLTEKYIQVADLDLSTLEGYQPIGADADLPFAGEYDGGAHTISGLTLETEADVMGIFGYLGEAGVISNLKIKDITIKGNSSIGGLVGIADGRISGVHGENIDITGTDAMVGGLVGYVNVHEGEDAEIFGSSVQGSNVTGSSGVGGIAGVITGKAEQSFVKGTSVRATDLSGVAGGLVGITESGADVLNSYSMAQVTAGVKSEALESEEGIVGGLVGHSKGNITNSYFVGANALLKADNVDPITPREVLSEPVITGELTNVYFDSDVYGTEDADGETIELGEEARTSEQMKSADLYADWDLEDVWEFNAEKNDGYPMLVLETERTPLIPLEPSTPIENEPTRPEPEFPLIPLEPSTPIPGEEEDEEVEESTELHVTVEQSTRDWTNESVILTVRIINGDDTQVLVLPDGTESKKAVTTYTATENGDYEFTLKDGEQSSSGTIHVSNIDTEGPSAPVIRVVGDSLDIKPGVDTLSGIAKHQYKINDGEWSDEYDLEALDSGKHTISARGVDKAGNAGEVATFNFVLNKIVISEDVDLDKLNSDISEIDLTLDKDDLTEEELASLQLLIDELRLTVESVDGRDARKEFDKTLDELEAKLAAYGKEEDIPLTPLEPSTPVEEDEEEEDIPLTPLEPSTPIEEDEEEDETPLTPLEPSTPIEEEDETPDDEDELPDDEDELPADEDELPADEDETPVDEDGEPIDSETPDDGGRPSGEVPSGTDSTGGGSSNNDPDDSATDGTNSPSGTDSTGDPIVKNNVTNDNEDDKGDVIVRANDDENQEQEAQTFQQTATTAVGLGFFGSIAAAVGVVIKRKNGQ